MTWHRVQQGECISSLAEQHGVTPARIWDCRENAELRRARRDGNILEPGDRVFIPALRAKQHGCVTDATHVFRRRGVPAKFVLRVVDDGAPREGVPFVADLAGREVQGRTDADGAVRLWIPPNLAELRLVLGEGKDARRYKVLLGHLDPASSVAGVRARLRNLGFLCAADGPVDDELRAAVLRFQHYIGHPNPDGALDQLTRRALVDLHDEE